MVRLIDAQTAVPVWTGWKQKDAAQKIVRHRSLLAAGAGLIPMPILDAISIISLQLWMIRDIAKVYGLPFEKHLAKSFIASLAGNLGTQSLLKFIPGLGNALAGLAVSFSAAAATYALGKVFMEHFNQGGTLLDFDPVQSRKYFKKVYEEKALAIYALESEEIRRLKACKEVVQLITTLKRYNKRLQENEKIYLELLDEADQVIAELQETLKEQEIDHLGYACTKGRNLPRDFA